MYISINITLTSTSPLVARDSSKPAAAAVDCGEIFSGSDVKVSSRVACSAGGS